MHMDVHGPQLLPVDNERLMQALGPSSCNVTHCVIAIDPAGFILYSIKALLLGPSSGSHNSKA